MVINIPNTFDCERNGENWSGRIDVKEANNHYCLATVSSRDTEFNVALSCYFDGYGMKEWCICVPNYNFGCKLSSVESGWNENQFKPYIKNAVDRRSLASALDVMLQELNNPKELNRTLKAEEVKKSEIAKHSRMGNAR